MRIAFHLTAIALFAALATTGVATADEHEVKERQLKFITAADGAATVIDVEKDLALGESREIATEDGKVIVITRTADDEIKVTVDGEEIAGPGDDLHDGELSEGEGDGHRRVKVRRIVEKDCEGDCEHEEAKVEVKKIIVLGDGSETVDVEALRVGPNEIQVTCEDDDEDCAAKIRELLGDEAGDSEKKVVVIKKIVRETDDE
jgi:hypothetical protein